MQETLSVALQKANEILMEYWPLHAFIATNPLWDKRHSPFYEIMSHHHVNGFMSIDYYLKQYQNQKITDNDIQLAIKHIENQHLDAVEIQQWILNAQKKSSQESHPILLASHIEEYQFQEPCSWIKDQICPLLRDYFGSKAYHVNDLRTYCFRENHILCSQKVPISELSIQDAIGSLLNIIGVPKDFFSTYLETIYVELYGWASLLKWRHKRPENPWIPGDDLPEVLLLLWLSFECIISHDLDRQYTKPKQIKPSGQSNDNLKLRYIWQTAFEFHYLNQLDNQLNKTIVPQSQKLKAQFIFCIDARSEGFRRHLESTGEIETFGFAGFFGAIFNIESDGKIAYQAPALVSAKDTLTLKTQKSKIERFRSQLSQMITSAKKQLSSPFALFEMTGIWLLPYMLYKTLLCRFARKVSSQNVSICNTLDLETQYQSAQTLLTSIGLNTNFANHILICAHQSDNVNNPFNASLNCGACGGNSGIPNALIMCDILNNPHIRDRLKTQANIEIPHNTQFIPACHHTVDDRLSILTGRIPAALESKISLAATRLKQEKQNSLPGSQALSNREKNWSELIPELGLINNTTIIIGPRSLTTGQNLGRRTFLHSYEPDLDPEGKILTSILSAPAIVAHWISSQYYFSTVNPNLFGAGNKAIHNVLPGVGVLEGNLSELKVGLPLQSTHFRSNPIHEPRRLIVTVYAKPDILKEAIQHAPEFKTLLENQWIFLKSINPHEDKKSEKAC